MFFALALLLTLFSIGLRLTSSGFSLARKVAKRGKSNGSTLSGVAELGLASATQATGFAGAVIRVFRNIFIVLGMAVGVLDITVFVVLLVSASGFLVLLNQTDKAEVTPTSSYTAPATTTPQSGAKVANDQSLGSITQLINKTHALPSDYVPSDLELVDLSNTWSGDMKFRKPALEELRKLFADAQSAGHTLKCVSGYRDYDLQTTLYNNAVANLGQEKADLESAQPGKSEHQSGLAMDVSCASEGYDLQETFGSTPEGKWIAENAHKYGFIVRYAADKTSITGYGYEPWHLRYLGIEMATAVKNSGLCYEEYIGITN